MKSSISWAARFDVKRIPKCDLIRRGDMTCCCENCQWARAQLYMAYPAWRGAKVDGVGR